ncbi:MAG: hypothetical protein P8M13_05150 [Luminiphilus sp.]|nr:hypothetical protein [Luminiphilus sp.]
MIASITALFISILPWFVGGLIGALMTKGRSGSIRIIAFAGAALIGQELIAALGLVLAHLGITIFTPIVPLLLALVGALLLFAHKADLRIETTGITFIGGGLLLGIICLLTFITFITLNTPTAGWDTLWYWAPISKEFIDVQLQNPPIRWSYSGTHPTTVAIISAWGAGWLANQAVITAYTGWVMCWLSITMTVGAYTHLMCKKLSLSLLLAYCVGSLPLLENHVTQGGYAEIFVAGHVAAATALLSIGAKNKDNRLLILGLILAVTTLALKNIGWLYGLAVIAGVFLSHHQTFTLRFQALILALLTLAFFATGWHSGDIEFRLGNRTLIVEPSNAAQIFINQCYMLFVNSSFSIVPLLFLVALGLSWRPINTHDQYLLDAPLVVAAAILGFLTLSQFTDYGFLYALPHNDTGNSRLSIPFAVVSVMTIPFILDRLKFQPAT